SPLLLHPTRPSHHGCDYLFFFHAEAGIRDATVTGVQTCALPISTGTMPVAAAVATGMVPVALGSQTGGSTIRPASFCGVYGLKPTHGLVPRHGMFRLSRTLDHVGLFARAIEDLALLMELVVGYDERDPDSRPRARVPYRDVAAEEPPLPPMFA